MVLLQFGLRLVQFKLAGAARHEQIDHPLRPGCMVQPIDRFTPDQTGRISGSTLTTHQAGQSHTTQRYRATTEEVPSGFRSQCCCRLGTCLARDITAIIHG